MQRPAARQTDPTSCPAHGSQPLSTPGAPKVTINSLAAMRMGVDGCACPTGPELITTGNPTVLMQGAAATRKGDALTHGGFITKGSDNVKIGDPAPKDSSGGPLAVPDKCKWLLDSMDNRPGGGDILDRLRSTPTLGPSEIVTIKNPSDSKDPNGTFEAKVTTVNVRGHEVKVYEPTAPPKPGEHRPTTQDIANALGTMSDQQLENTESVVISPIDHEAGAPASCPPPKNGKTKSEIHYFPRSAAHPQGDYDWALIHESSHTYVHKNGLPPGWAKAIAEDGRYVNNYATSHPIEDFCESVVMFALTKGTECEATARALFPNRYAILEKTFPNGFPKRK